MKNIYKISLITLALMPSVAFAQLGRIGALFAEARMLVTTVLVPLLIDLAVLAFFWGLVKFIFAQGSEKSSADGKKIMIWGLIGLFVMISVWGIIKFFQDILGVGGITTLPPPTI